MTHAQLLNRLKLIYKLSNSIESSFHLTKSFVQNNTSLPTIAKQAKNTFEKLKSNDKNILYAVWQIVHAPLSLEDA